MENKEIEIIDYEGNEYGVLEELDDIVYTVNIADKDDIKLFKSFVENGEEFVEELNEEEKDDALDKFYKKYKYLFEEKK